MDMRAPFGGDHRSESGAPAGTPGGGEEVRIWVYRNVPALFGPIPDALPRLAGDLRTDPSRSNASSPAAGAAYPETRAAIADLIAEFARHPRERMETDQVRLFVNAPGGVAAPPYATWYLDGRLSGPSLAWVIEEYQRQALELTGDAGEPADFIGAEMEYMHFLCRHAHAARLTADRSALEHTLDSSARFFREHLGRWLPLFADRIRAATAGGVYAKLADLLAAFCREEGSHLHAQAPSRAQ